MAPEKNSIFLIGMPGSGKTAVGHALARLRNLEFVDLDKALEARTGVGIPVIFEYEGEEGFRQRESRLLAEMTLTPNIVLSTGGGTVLSPQNRQVLRERGLVLYLAATLDLLWARLSESQTVRPLLKVSDPVMALNKMYEERDPLYKSVAHLTFQVKSEPVKETADKLSKFLNKSCVN